MKDDVTNCTKVKRGSELPHAKLSEGDVKLIRELHEYKQREIARLNKDLGVSALAEKFEVSRRAVERVLARETWIHV